MQYSVKYELGFIQQTKPTKPNLPNQTYQTEPNKPNIPNQTQQAKPINLNYITKPTKPNLPNKTFQRDKITAPALDS